MREWDEFLKKEEIEFGKDTVDRWLRSLKIVRFDACNLFLEAQDSFQSSWFDEHIRPKLSQFVNCNKKPIKIHLEVMGEKAPVKPRVPAKKTKDPTTSYQLTFDTLDPSFSFDTFIVQDENLVAFKVLEETCTKLVDSKLQAMSSFNPDSDATCKDLINPVVLYGPAGSGKTHLLQAFCQKLTRVGYKAIYARSETFTDHVVKAIRGGNMSHFREFYRAVDVLIIDDIQHLGKKNATQEEFFHTFNTLHTLGKMIVLSSNSCPEVLQNIEPRLISRFVWGIVLPLTSLGKKDLVKMIEKKSQVFNYPLAPRAAEFLAETFSSNPKSTVRALEALMLRSHLAKKSKVKAILPVNMVKELLQDLIEKEKTEEVSPERILNRVSEYYGITSQDLLGKSRKQECVVPRQLAMYLCREVLKFPYMKIGDLFSRDHSTVMSSIRQVENEMSQKENDLIQAYNSIKLQL